MSRAKARALSSFARAVEPTRPADDPTPSAGRPSPRSRGTRLVRVYVPPEVDRDATRLARQLAVDLDGVTKAEVLGALIRVGQAHLDEVRDRLTPGSGRRPGATG